MKEQNGFRLASFDRQSADAANSWRTRSGRYAPARSSDDLKALVYEIAPEHKIKAFEETGDVDFGYEFPGFARFRANFFNQKYGIAAVFRQIPSKVLTADELGPCRRS